jgi:hypothetical protein
MEHAFDALSKRLARAVSRREAISTLLRGAVGAFLVSAGFTRLSLHAQSGACSVCGTCATLDVSTKSLTATCTGTCEAQTLCNTAQSYAPYQDLVSTLTDSGFQPTAYDALVSVKGKSQTQLFHTNYVGADPSYTADLFVVWAPGGQASAFAVEYQNGNPLLGYYVNGASVVQVAPGPQIPLPFAISASPSSVTVAQGSSVTSTITTTVSSGFSSAIKLTASGLPSGVTASFKPSSIKKPGSGSSLMTIKAGASTAMGTYAITVTGTGNKISETTSVSLTVDSPAAVAALVEVPDGTSVGDLQHLAVDSPSAEIIPAITSKYCDCSAAGAAVGALGNLYCEDAVVWLVGDGCLLLGPLAGPCLLAGFFAGTLMTKACEAGADPAFEYLCHKFCSCPPCWSDEGTGCLPTCQASEPSQPGYCPPPGFCDPNSCACATPTCPPGDTPCGANCCSYVNGLCIPYIGNGGALTCFPPGTVACSDGNACLPGIGTPVCCVSPEGYKYDNCCYEGEQCCQIPYATWCCPATTSCGTSYLSCVT